MSAALVHAAKNNQIKNLRKLIADATWSAQKYRDALDEVAKRGYKKLVFLVANQGIAAADTSEILGKTGELSPLMHACSNGHLGTVSRLVYAGSDVNGQEYVLGNMPLHNAARNGHVNIVKFLLSEGAKVDAKNSHAETALHLACASGQYHVAKLLIKSGASIHKATAIPQGTALSVAAKTGDVRLLRLLHEGRYMVTHQLPVYNAAMRGHLAAVKYLLHKGHSSNDRQLIPNLVSLVRYDGGFDILEYMLKQEGSKDVTGALENLCHVQDCDYVKTLELLLSHGANINCDAFERYQCPTATLLGIEASQAKPNLFRMRELIKHGANIDQKDNNDMSPMDYAASCWRDHPSLYFLLEVGADPTLVDAFGRDWVPENVARAVSIVTQKLLLDVALLLKPFNLPTLVVYRIYMKVMCDRPHVTMCRFDAWKLLTAVKKN